MNCCAPGSLFGSLPLAQDKRNQRSFHMGMMEIAATVAGRRRMMGKMSQNTRYSLAPSTRAASFSSPGTWLINCVNMKTASGSPPAI